MKPSVALVSDPSHGMKLESLAALLEQMGIASTVCPFQEPRDRLRWVMELDPTGCSICLIADNDGKIAGSLSTAVERTIPVVAWFPNNPDINMPGYLMDTSVLITISRKVETVAGIIANLLHVTPTSPAVIKPEKIEDSTTLSLQRESVNPAPVIIPNESPEDLALYEQLEAMMTLPVKERSKPEPVQIQVPGLDFSLPLRVLMTQGRELAHNRKHAEVMGVHYIAETDEPFASIFRQAGLSDGIIDEYIEKLNARNDPSAEPLMSDEVFAAVTHAKEQARQKGSNCIKVSDFIGGLITLPKSSVAELLEFAGISADELRTEIKKVGPVNESCEGSFFAPSSLDQDSFYQFDPAAVRSVEDRLRDLPGFRKAAKRVAETQSSKKVEHNAGPTMVPKAVMASEPPERPEIVKISSDFPPVDVIEQVADLLLEGQIVAFPSDIMFALAADAANATAVERLRDAAEISPDKPLSILIHSTSQLKHLVRADLDALEGMLDELWPGPLTLVMKATPGLARQTGSNGTIAVRQPSDNTTLAVLSMLGRPLAVTSIDEVRANGKAPDAESVVEKLTGQIALVVDDSLPPQEIRTTVVDMTKSPWEILREGAIPGERVLAFYRR